MKTITVIEDSSRANRNNNMGGYKRICEQIMKEMFNEVRETGGCTMTWDYYKTTSYKRTNQDFQVDIFIDFNKGTINVTTID